MKRGSWRSISSREVRDGGCMIETIWGELKEAVPFLCGKSRKEKLTHGGFLVDVRGK